MFVNLVFLLSSPQPSVRGLFTAISSLRQKLDNIMPTLKGGEEGIILARRFLADRIAEENAAAAAGKHKRRESILSNNIAAVSNTISHIGETKNSERVRESNGKMLNLRPLLLAFRPIFQFLYNRSNIMERTFLRFLESGFLFDRNLSKIVLLPCLFPGQEARAHRSSLTAALSSMFRSGSKTSTASASLTSSPSSHAVASQQQQQSPHSGPASAGHLPASASLHNMSNASSSSASMPPLGALTLLDESGAPAHHYFRQLSTEVRSHALAAVLLEEWLQELAAIAQEHCVLQKEQAFEMGMGLGAAAGPQPQGKRRAMAAR